MIDEKIDKYEKNIVWLVAQEKTQQNLHAQNPECTPYKCIIGTEIQPRYLKH
ncbi:hypothetical protein GNE08_06410 [Trichormus variabilis ARAD]|uniref:Uncharacterized protein n=1 Tax=Trichormus variabilis N2B TaxID=2681315 RepID=A0ABR6S4T2_ANAVA|nr:MULTISPECIES: hypothetical protein [Nostocaceae]MBC1213854.1 hypothetical protein [Trichormus variabilis ARAD]MBC1253828.1 hypothetical protein [Trichormus variabilis V5]MBC1265734.1 hypothetical protein [Trichormus variabilis FSR]MBC1301394.1 hypothetical protein [Trichormus variabilis N2B]MBC1309883.1 hypothetical protein [Trichormus variabilis PNB]